MHLLAIQSSWRSSEPFFGMTEHQKVYCAVFTDDEHFYSRAYSFSHGDVHIYFVNLWQNVAAASIWPFFSCVRGDGGWMIVCIAFQLNQHL